MTGKAATLIIFCGGPEDSPPERMLAQAKEAIVLDTIERASHIEVISSIIVATNSPRLIERLSGQEVLIEPDPPGESFHFGRRLQEVIRKHSVEVPIYVGGGSAPLFPQEELRGMAERVMEGQELMVTNNLFSTDFVAFNPGWAIERIRLPATDNNLSWLLREQAGLKPHVLPKTVTTQMDVDTPTDLMVIGYHPGLGPETRRYLESLKLDTSHIERTMSLFTDREREITVAGRVPAVVWERLEHETACRVRFLSEERGMRASGRQEEGQVRSILGFYLEEVGPRRFFQAFARMTDALFLDSRVLLAHLGLWPSAADRFYSDLLQPDEIGHPFLREFTAAAREVLIPIVLGGHCLVSSGVCLLAQAAWDELDARLGRPAPESQMM